MITLTLDQFKALDTITETFGEHRIYRSEIDDTVVTLEFNLHLDSKTEPNLDSYSTVTVHRGDDHQVETNYIIGFGFPNDPKEAKKFYLNYIASAMSKSDED